MTGEYLNFDTKRYARIQAGNIKELDHHPSVEYLTLLRVNKTDFNSVSFLTVEFPQELYKY